MQISQPVDELSSHKKLERAHFPEDRPRNQGFVGREFALLELNSKLGQGDRHNRAVVFGLGGVGYALPPLD